MPSTTIQATPQNLSRAPAQAGIYVLYERGIIIYVGRAQGGNSTIRNRLQSHRAGREGPCTRNFTHYRYETTRADVTRERELLRAYRQRHNRLPRCNDRMP